ncbi:hypothetical protein MUCCIDRAFT_156240 [Mucor lusitanicus CBS 277.49]|uniref:SAYSvFN domain-containing protein n=1 Tax=Mucor lusitanicus CBS 277.49 TaxID=747725 RepID=A0A168LNL4_MUCCL|nr:hypothetical protein MUCCIDRAFT_156240 [Mucor lusitanicus CBS 277.49]
MADIVKFNSEDQPALEMNEAPQEERERQQENQQEIEHIQNKAHVQDTETQALQEEKEKAPGNVLDAAGHVHTESQQDASDAHQHEGGNVLPEQSNPHAHVWSNDPNEPFAGQWAPSMTKEPETYDTKEGQPIANDADHSKKSRHHRLGSQSSDLNRTFESTMTDLKNIFNTSDEGFPHQKDHHKLHNPTPLNPIQPDELIWNLQIKAIKYILVASLVCYLVGRLRFGYIMGIIIICLCAWAYWNLGRTSSAGLEWQLEKQENMKTVGTDCVVVAVSPCAHHDVSIVVHV